MIAHAKLRRRRGLAKLAALLGACLVSLSLASAAWAHAELIGSVPEAGAAGERSPDRVTARFDPELDTRLSTLVVYDAGGRPVEGAAGGVDLDDLDRASMIVRPEKPLPAGAYSVRWHAVDAVDGDATDGVFTFSLGGTAVPLEEPPAPAASPAPQVESEAPATPEPAVPGGGRQTAEPSPSPALPSAEAHGGSPAGWIAAALGGFALVAAGLGVRRLARGRAALPGAGGGASQ